MRKDNRNTVSSVKPRGLIKKGTLREVKLQFWERYKAKYPVEVSPPDQLLSRCCREMEERLLTVYNVQGVNTLARQARITKKRRQEKDKKREAKEASGTYGVEEYMAKLYTSFGPLDCRIR